jgi:hypothetical protein
MAKDGRLVSKSTINLRLRPDVVHSILDALREAIQVTEGEISRAEGDVEHSWEAFVAMNQESLEAWKGARAAIKRQLREPGPKVPPKTAPRRQRPRMHKRPASR